MRTGIVKWFNRHKGYGLIRPNDVKEDVFVFYPSIQQEGHKMLISGQVVKFHAKEDAHGKMTTHVEIV